MTASRGFLASSSNKSLGSRAARATNRPTGGQSRQLLFLPCRQTNAHQRAAMEMRVALLLVAVAAASASAAEAANYTVGDDKGWNPDVDYTAWVKKHKPFYKGDWLLFEYQNGRSDVVQVDEVGYDNCDKANAVTSYSKGHSWAFQLKEAKDYYFICSYGYCYSGMKLHVTAKSKTAASTGGKQSGDSSSSSGDDSSSSDGSSADDSSPPPSKKSKAKSSAAPPAFLAATPLAAVGAAAALLLNRML